MEDKTDLDREVEESQEAARRATELMNADPKLPFISAFVMARDLMGSDRSLQWLREGKYPWKLASLFTGSYGRLDLRVRAAAEGLITDAQALEGLAEEWSGSDPDDTDPRFLLLWKKAVAANGEYLRDGKTLPRRRRLTIYRGQDKGAPFGIAWSLDARVAHKFAKGAATRQGNRDGVVYWTMVQRGDVLGYMTGRGEAEVIIDPAALRMHPVVL